MCFEATTESARSMRRTHLPLAAMSILAALGCLPCSIVFNLICVSSVEVLFDHELCLKRNCLQEHYASKQSNIALPAKLFNPSSVSFVLLSDNCVNLRKGLG